MKWRNKMFTVAGDLFTAISWLRNPELKLEIINLADEPLPIGVSYASEEIAGYKVFVVMPTNTDLVGLVFVADDDQHVFNPDGSEIRFDTEKSITIGLKRLWLRYNANFDVKDYVRLLMATEHHNTVPHDVKKILKRSNTVINFTNKRVYLSNLSKYRNKF